MKNSYFLEEFVLLKSNVDLDFVVYALFLEQLLIKINQK